MADTHPTINARELVAVLQALPPDQSVLIEGPHGIGKSQIARALSAHFELPLIDRRLAQMTEGDMIGLPMLADLVTRFLPVDWFKRACDDPAVLLLDELNRGTTEITNAAFQIVLDRELNGNVLHPQSRVIACINSGANYSVNDIDAALVSRFSVFHFMPDTDDWITWAQGKIDPVLVDYIRHHPSDLRFTDVGSIESLTSHPTPRGWEKVDHCLKHAGMVPSEVCGTPTPPVFFQMVASIVGHPSAIGFTKFVREYARVVTAEDILDRYAEAEPRVAQLGHDGIVSVLDKIGEHCKNNNWTAAQVANLADFAEKYMSGEDHVLLFSRVASTRNMGNIKLWHATKLPGILVKAVNTSQDLNKKT